MCRRCCRQIREHKDSGIYVDGMSEHFVTSPAAVYDTIRQGSENRAVASTNMNRDSSRSHSVFILTLIQKNLETLTCTTGALGSLAASSAVREGFMLRWPAALAIVRADSVVQASYTWSI